MKTAVALLLIIVVSSSAVMGVLAVRGYFNADPSNTPEQHTPPTQLPTSVFATLSTPTSPPLGALVVPDDYPTISKAVAAAHDGQAIFVRRGQYNESVTVDKSVWLIGENQTVVDANSLAECFIICHSNVNVTGFTFQNTPTPATGEWWQQMQGIGVPVQLADIQIQNAQFCYIYANNLTGSAAGVQLIDASQNAIITNRISGNGAGVIIESSSGNYVQSNIFSKGGTAVNLRNDASANIVVDNTIYDANFAIYLDSAHENTLKGNKVTHCLYGFGVTGTEVSDYVNYVDASNIVEGKPIYYMVGESGGVVPADAGAVVLVNCVDMTVQDAVLPLGQKEITLVNTNNSLVKANIPASTDAALLKANYMPQPPLHILLFYCFNNSLVDNQATIHLNCSSGNTLSANTGVMHLTYSDNNQVTANNVTSLYFDVKEANGIVLEHSSGNVVKQNTVCGNAAGIVIVGTSSGNIIMQNNIASNAQGGIMVSTVLSNLMGSTNENDPNKLNANIIYGNAITRNGNQGMLECGYGTQILGNTFSENSNCGLQLTNCYGTIIEGNVIDGIFFGIMGNNTRNVIVAANTINRPFASYCVWLITAYPAVFYHNNFYGAINFSHYADNFKNSSVSDAVACMWENGGEGNYWSGNNGSAPYDIGFGFYDNHPLTSPFDISQAIPSPPPV
jgi:parallel beta-helix repeat protein